MVFLEGSLAPGNSLGTKYEETCFVHQELLVSEREVPKIDLGGRLSQIDAFLSSLPFFPSFLPSPSFFSPSLAFCILACLPSFLVIFFSSDFSLTVNEHDKSL